MARRMVKLSMHDLQVENHGSIFLVRPGTDATHFWLVEHTAKDAQWFGNALVVEPRYVSDLIEGACADGLVAA